MKRNVTVPTLSATLGFGDMGYKDWEAEVLLNPSGVIYEKLLNDDLNEFWKGLKEIIIDWNFLTVDGKPLPLPKDWVPPAEGEVLVVNGKEVPLDIVSKYILHLPYGLWRALLDKYFTAFNKTVIIPKESEGNSGSTSSINGAVPAPVEA